SADRSERIVGSMKDIPEFEEALRLGAAIRRADCPTSGNLASMTHAEKVAYAIQDLGRCGISPFTVAPPFFRLLWLLGSRIPPPLFLRFADNALLLGSFFGILFGGSMWLIQWQYSPLPQATSVLVAVLASLFAGVLFGRSMGWYFTWKN